MSNEKRIKGLDKHNGPWYSLEEIKIMRGESLKKFGQSKCYLQVLIRVENEIEHKRLLVLFSS